MNINIKTYPTGRSPKAKYFFGERANLLDKTRTDDVQIGDASTFNLVLQAFRSANYKYSYRFKSNDRCFNVQTTSYDHAKFVQNMFQIGVTEDPDWTIYHNIDMDVDPTVWIELDRKIVLIAGTSYLGEIKKSVFTIMGIELPLEGKLPMHCGSFTYEGTTNLMFGLSGTGKTTLSSDPDFKLIGDDELTWTDEGLRLIETGCYAKTEGLHPKTHKTIYDAMEKAKEEGLLIEENVGHSNARASYPTSVIENAWTDRLFDHPDNIFFLTMDVTGVIPPVSELKGDAIELFFRTGYTSKMPGTEDGVKEIKKVFSPCYGGPFMPLPVKTYTDMLMEKVKKHDCRVFLVNTGMDKDGKRFPLNFTRKSIKHVITEEFETKQLSYLNPVVSLDDNEIDEHGLAELINELVNH